MSVAMNRERETGRWLYKAWSGVLLGLAAPSGHTALTWPANATDTIWGYDETKPLYPGDTLGTHPERLNGNGGCTVPAGSAATCPAAPRG